MAKIEVSREQYESLDFLFHRLVRGGAGPSLRPLAAVLELMDPFFPDEDDLTQVLPGPDGWPNELVPADFFS